MLKDTNVWYLWSVLFIVDLANFLSIGIICNLIKVSLFCKLCYNLWIWPILAFLILYRFHAVEEQGKVLSRRVGWGENGMVLFPSFYALETKIWIVKHFVVLETIYLSFVFIFGHWLYLCFMTHWIVAFLQSGCNYSLWRLCL